MIETRQIGWALAALVAGTVFASATDGSGPVERRLQPFGELEAGRYVTLEILRSAAAPGAGTRRAERWAQASEAGLEALVVRPDRVRGAYRDLHATHSAWQARQP